MLSDITIMILAVMTPVLSVFCFIKGYNIGAREQNKPEIKVETPKKAIENRKKSKEAEAKYKRFQSIMENIENYQGDCTGQREIK